MLRDKEQTAADAMKVLIEIDRLVLDGISATAHERAQIRASVERELARLIGEQGVGHGMRTASAVPRAQAPSIEHRAGSPRRTGEQIARSVYASLGTRR